MTDGLPFVRHTSTRRAALAYTILGGGLVTLPLLRVLHVESSAVVAFVAFFVSGWAGLAAFERGDGLARVWRRNLALLGIPWAFLTVSTLWAPNCAYLTGLGVYLLFPGVTVLFAVALAYALDATGWTGTRWMLGAVGLGVAVLGPLYDLGLHPQFYTYNHVFGGVLGPIYDEQLAVRPGLFVFRGLTLLWTILAVLVGHRLRGDARAVVRGGIPLVALLIGGVYFFAADLGLNTPAWYTRAQLGGHVRTAHVDVYYDTTSTTERAARAWAADHEYQYHRLVARLDLAPGEQPDRIQSFIYPNADVKARLTGARQTSVAPVWLADPQMHMLEARMTTSLDHEMAHVVTRRFGLPLLNASWAVGLVEGWAVALEAPEAGPAPDDLVLAAATADTTRSLTRRADALADRLSPLGFWTGRGAVSYTTMGSFVGFLIDRYGAGSMKRVYARADFASVYGVPLDTLARAWAGHLRERPRVDRSAHDVVSATFARPSLFETRCPHYVPPYRRRMQDAERALRQADTTRALRALRDAVDRQPQALDAHVRLATLRLARGRAAAVRQQLDTLTVERPPPSLLWTRAHAHAVLGDTRAARTLYTRSVERLPAHRWAARASAMLLDAVAHRPDVMQVLVRGGSAVRQAQRLAALTPQTPAVRAWRALRLQAAHRYDRAYRLWTEVDAPLRADRPLAWHRTGTLQQRVWMADAALRAGLLDAARSHAEAAAQQARRYGAAGTERQMEALQSRIAWRAEHRAH
jgi:hypothetical protein